MSTPAAAEAPATALTGPTGSGPAATPPAAPPAGAPPPASPGPAGAPAPAPATPEAGKPAAPAAPATPAVPPAPIEVKFPDGVKADEALLGKFKPLAAELGLKSEGAQKLVDLFTEAQKSWHEQGRAELEKQQESWLESLKADKEFGGADMDAHAQVARKAMVKFGTPELRTFLDQTGLGNHPELVRLAYRVGKALGEDSIQGTSGGAARGGINEQERLRKLYPNSPQMFESNS